MQPKTVKHPCVSIFLVTTTAALFFLSLFTQTVLADPLASPFSPPCPDGSFGITSNIVDGVVCPGELIYPLVQVYEGVGVIHFIIRVLVGIAVTSAFLYFFWNLAQYVKEGDADGKEEAKGKMLWAVLAIFVITSFWGLVAFVRSVLGVNSGEGEETHTIFIPDVKLKKCKNNEIFIQYDQDIIAESNAESGCYKESVNPCEKSTFTKCALASECHQIETDCERCNTTTCPPYGFQTYNP